MSELGTSKLIPNAIHGYWLEDEEFLSTYALVEKWTPFEASCLINGMKPGKIVGGVARVGLVPELMNQYDENPQEWVDPESLITLTKIILRNYDKRRDVPASDVVDWAVENGLLRPSSYLAKRLGENTSKTPEPTPDKEPSDAVLQNRLEETISKLDAAYKQIEMLHTELEQAKKDTKLTGKQHMENRFAILGAALNEIAAECPSDRFTNKGRLIAAKVAKHLDENRDLYNIPEIYGFSYENILDTIRAARRAGVKNNTE